MDSDLFCRVCGLKQSEPPWGEDGESPTFEICDCCGVEFGYEDNTYASTLKFRKKWLKEGAHWFHSENKPKKWTLEKQLTHIPKPFQD